MAPKPRPLPPEVASLSGETEVTLQQFSQLLGVTYQTAKRYCDKGFVASIRRGGQRIIKASEVRRFMESGNDGAQDPNSGKAADHYKNTRQAGPPADFKTSDLE